MAGTPKGAVLAYTAAVAGRPYCKISGIINAEDVRLAINEKSMNPGSVRYQVFSWVLVIVR